MKIHFDRREMEENLRDFVDDVMYRRGQVYYRYGNVQWIDANAKSECVEIEAGVLGTEDYYTTLIFDTKTFHFKGGECDCPYDDYCKHMAAVGLKFLEKFEAFLNQTDFIDANDSENVAGSFVAWLKNKPRLPQKIIAISPTNDDNKDTKIGKLNISTLETTLRSIGIDPSVLSSSALEELRTKMAGAPRISIPPPTEKPKSAKKPFSERYYILINMSYGKIHPDIIENGHSQFYYRMNNERETAARLLKKEALNLMSAERDFLIFLRDKNSWEADYNHGEFFILLKNSGLSAYLEDKTSNSKINFEENPKKIGAEIFKREDEKYAYEENHVETAFVFRIDRKYTSAKQRNEKEALFVGTKYAVTFNGKNVALHPLTPLTSGILKRILNNSANDYRYYNYGKTDKEHLERLRETELKDEEVIRINDVLREARESFEIITDIPLDMETCEYKNARQMIVIDYDREKNTLDMRAMVDYGVEKIDVSESVSASHRIGKISFERQTYLSLSRYETHIIRISDKTVSYAKIEKQKEIALFKKFYYDVCGFNKHIKCHLEGERQIAKFAFGAFLEIQKLGLPIEFAKDELKTATGNFKADFSVQMDVEIDWLAFDVACYCGEDKILPEDLRDYIHNNREFLKMADGTLKKVTNREELERFVAMLESFNARENGRFEGRVYNAPELDNIFTSSEYYNAKLSAGFQKFIKEAKSGRPVKKVRIPSLPAKILRDYQKDAVHWFYFLRKYRFAGILADDMGLGKTLQALTLLHMNKSTEMASLVVCPKTLLSVWQDEATKFFPDMKTVIIDGTPTERALKIRSIHEYDLAITSYPTLQKDEEIYKERKTPFHYLLLDEAQNIKNHKTKNSQIVKKIDAEYRLALTGTPLENTVGEVWSLFEFLMPGFLGNHASFTRGFLKPIMKENDAGALAHLRQKVECFMLRRTKGEVLKELPAKIEQTRSCKMTDAQNMLYQEILARVKKDIFDSVKEKGYEKSHIHILAGLTKLRQVCNHPVLLLKDKNYRKYESAKLELFNEIIKEIVSAGRKVLVFSQFTTMLDILAEELKSQKIGYAYLSGKTNNRKEVVASFSEDKTKSVFLISLKAGGTGLTLTSADNVIIFDPWWNPSVENQAIDRTHRIGQKNTVNVYKLITEGTIEEKILELQKRKKFLFDSLVGESGDLFKKITWDDIRGLF